MNPDSPIPFALTEDAAQLELEPDAPPVDWSNIQKDPRLALLDDDAGEHCLDGAR
jgi:hypothetical protein